MLRHILPAVLVMACTPAFAIDLIETSSPGAPIDSTLPAVVDTIEFLDPLTMQDVEITFDVVHTWQADLEVSLESPDGTSVQLTNDSGGSADNLFCTFGVLGNPFTPAYLADPSAEMEAQGPGAMADFVGESAIGIWTLTINDDAGGDVGTLNSWTLRVSDDPATPAAPFPPTNDDCSSAITVGQNSVTSYNTGAATDSLIDNGCSGATNLDVWYQLNLPAGCDGTVEISVCSALYTGTVAIYDGTAGCPVPGSIPLDCSTDNCGTGITYNHVSGGPTVLYIQAGGLNGDSGLAELTVSTVLVGPLNDFCIDAEPVTVGTTAFYDTSCATQDGINPGCGSTTTDPFDVWYSVEVPAGCDAMTFSTDGSGFDTRIAVWDGTACPIAGDAPIDCDDDGGAGLQSFLMLSGLVPGDMLLVQVGGFSAASGAGQLDVECFVPAGNDFCVDRIDIFSGATSFDTLSATSDGINPGCGGGTNPIDIWFEYTVTDPGQVDINTFGSGFDTRLAVWPAGACPNPGDAPLFCNDDTGGLQSQIIIPGVSPGDTFIIQVGGFGGAMGSGTIEIINGLGPAPDVENLSCVPNTDSIAVSWTNPVVYDEIVVTLDTVVVATLPGTATSYDVTGLTSFTSYTVGVLGVGDPLFFGPGNEVTCTVTTPGDATGEVVIVAAEFPSDIDSVAALDVALQSTGATPLILPAISDIGGTPSSIWVVLGTFPDNEVLTSADGAALVAFQAAGVPLYVSGGDTWGFDAQTDFETIDGIAPGTLDGNDSHVAMVGADFLVGFDAAYNQDQVGNDYTDQLFPATGDSLGSDARVAFADAGGTYNTAVAYYVTSGGPVFSTSTEFGGYAGNQNDLAAALVGFLGGTVVMPGDEFRRGDTNNDGGFDISDTIFLLGSLFVPGSPAAVCADSADANDDGGIDISDAIFMLSALFVPGSPNPLPPGPTTCGVDPTMDALDCATSSCP